MYLLCFTLAFHIITVIRDDNYFLPLGTSRRGLNVLNNDDAAPGRTLFVESARALEGNQGYDCEVSGSQVRVRFLNPQGKFVGDARCEYKACDECGRCGTARISITVGSSPSPTKDPTPSPTPDCIDSPAPGMSFRGAFFDALLFHMPVL